MREIKFRLPIYYKDNKAYRFHYWGFIKEPWGLVFVGIPIDPKTAQEIEQQWTGLKDQYGVEIYEGEIVEKWNHCSLLDRLSPLYNKGVGYYKSLTTTVKWSEQGLNYNIYPHHNDSYWEVIGNIYENKELLDGKGT